MVFVKTSILKQVQWLIKMIHWNTPAPVWMFQHLLGTTQKPINLKMFPRQNQNQFRNSNADVQFFYGSNTTPTNIWNKPVGVSHIYIMLIGSGGNGNSSNGGGSGAVTVWYGAAQNVPDSLVLQPSPSGNTTSYVYYRGSSSTLVTLLSASGGTTGGAGGVAMTANQFANSGFFQSVAGQAGNASTQNASATTFLSGGNSGQSNTANYGYSIPGIGNGFSQLQPIIVGVGASGSSNTNRAGFGCGGSLGTVGGIGGQGLIIIGSW